MRICASIGDAAGLSSPDLALADLAEIRLDLIGSLPDRIPALPLLVTLRQENVDIEALREAQTWAVSSGAEMFDLEDGQPLLVNGDIAIVSSHHDWDRTPDPDTIIGILGAAEGDVAKAAFMVNSLRDLRSIWEAARRIDRPHVLLGMGDLGTVTRIRQAALGNEFTFASLGEGTAPGQIPIGRMREIGDDGMITGILGHPLSHSLSPSMHDAAFRSVGMKGTYLTFDVREPGDLANLGEVMEAYDIRGLNVTIPYKVECMEQLDGLDAQAEAVGAVNTIIRENGELMGMNTDVKGIEGAFRIAGEAVEGKRALIIGAGGAARAAAVFLSKQGCDILVTTRDKEKGNAFTRDFDASFRMREELRGDGFDVVINCTPLGMKGFPALSPLPPALLGPEHVVMDMVYEPRMTPLLLQATQAGSRVVQGIDMLVAQARESFRIWTGTDPGHEVMRRAVP